MSLNMTWICRPVWVTWFFFSIWASFLNFFFPALNKSERIMRGLAGKRSTDEWGRAWCGVTLMLMMFVSRNLLSHQKKDGKIINEGLWREWFLDYLHWLTQSRAPQSLCSSCADTQLMQFLFAVPDTAFPWLLPWFFPYKKGLSMLFWFRR